MPACGTPVGGRTGSAGRKGGNPRPRRLARAVAWALPDTVAPGAVCAAGAGPREGAPAPGASARCAYRATVTTNGLGVVFSGVSSLGHAWPPLSNVAAHEIVYCRPTPERGLQFDHAGAFAHGRSRGDARCGDGDFERVEAFVVFGVG